MSEKIKPPGSMPKGMSMKTYLFLEDLGLDESEMKTIFIYIFNDVCAEYTVTRSASNGKQKKVNKKSTPKKKPATTKVTYDSQDSDWWRDQYKRNYSYSEIKDQFGYDQHGNFVYKGSTDSRKESYEELDDPNKKKDQIPINRLIVNETKTLRQGARREDSETHRRQVVKPKNPEPEEPARKAKSKRKSEW